MKIGFIGLGNMGAPMAQRLAEAGHKIIGYDLMENAIAALPKDMITIANDALMQLDQGYCHNNATRRQIASISCRRNHSSYAEGSCLIDCSTVDVNTARVVAEQVQRSQYPWT